MKIALSSRYECLDPLNSPNMNYINKPLDMYQKARNNVMTKSLNNNFKFKSIN